MCCFNKYSNTEIRPKWQTELHLLCQLEGNEYTGVSFLLLTADQEFIDRQMPDLVGFAFLSNTRLCGQVYMCVYMCQIPGVCPGEIGALEFD